MTMKTIVRVRNWVATVVIGLALLVPQANGQEPAAPADNVSMEVAEVSEILQIRIAAKKGQVAWGDILRAMVRTGQFNDGALKDKLPSGTLDLNLDSSRFVLIGINAFLSPDINMRIVPGDAGQDNAHLLVKIDQAAIREKRRNLNRQIREKLRDPAGELFGLQLSEGWQQTDDNKALVIVIHGFNSSPLRFRKLVDTFQRAEFNSGIFSYPDDQPIVDSALLLSNELKAIAAKHPKRAIALVTHSMGGLVARATVEDPELDPGNVTKLIMIAPPTHGSLLANYSFGIDVLDHASPDPQRGDVSRWYAAVADGMNEAAVDLTPGSHFLRRLNARPRNPNISYSIILGTGARVTKARLENYRQQLKSVQSQSEVTSLLTPHLDATLADLEEVLEGKGDDVVAVKRGRLEGVEDTILLKFTHLEALQNENELEGHELYESVLTRLRK
ncbi:esterase/lipase family protein [Adhaeretor mobilis]|nr:YqiA/YcfP family alpha/beta fold hydrolase [Adhaeretor mobilis]